MLVFGVGVLLSYVGRPGSLGWMLLVLYVAYAGQVVGGLLFGSSLSAFVGAAVMTPVAVFVATQRTGPPTLVTFLPAFWLLVPGAIALVGVTQVMGEARVDGVSAILGAGVTIVSIALGVVLGSQRRRLGQEPGPQVDCRADRAGRHRHCRGRDRAAALRWSSWNDRQPVEVGR